MEIPAKVIRAELDEYLGAGPSYRSCARPKVLGCGTRWDKAGRMRDKLRCLLGFFVAPPADGGSRLLVGVFPPFGDFRGGVDGF